MIPTGRQVREGRALTGLTQADLAMAAGIPVSLLARIEAVDGMVVARMPDWMAIQAALKAAGVEFIPEDGDGAGVRLRKMAP